MRRFIVHLKDDEQLWCRRYESKPGELRLYRGQGKNEYHKYIVMPHRVTYIEIKDSDNES